MVSSLVPWNVEARGVSTRKPALTLPVVFLCGRSGHGFLVIGIFESDRSLEEISLFSWQSVNRVGRVRVGTVKYILARINRVW